MPSQGGDSRNLQPMIRNAPREFFAELGEQLLPLGEEIRPSEVVDDRIDLLALDADGAAVIIELKRGAVAAVASFNLCSAYRGLVT